MTLHAHIRPLIAGILIVFSCLGLARFAFGMILPNMQLYVGMNATQAGVVSSSNFLGYFIGLFVVQRFYAKFSVSTLITRALWALAASMVMMALTSHYLWAASAFIVTGFFGAIANISVMTYIAQVVPPHIKGKATGIVIAGIGLAIIVSGVVVPLIEMITPISWRISWAIFATLIIGVGLYVYPTLSAFEPHPSNYRTGDTLYLRSILTHGPFIKTGLLFCIFGMTAIMYMTFFVVAATSKWNVSTEISGTFWAILGVSSLFSGPLFGVLSDRIGRYQTLCILFMLQALAHGLLALPIPAMLLFVSASLFGFSTWAVPSIMTTLSAELFGPSHTARILSLVTIFFGVGQIIGPLLAGMVTDSTGDAGVIFGFSCACLLLAALISWISSTDKKK